tara:strand:- start:768 stop:935 length:168 start_codon:yes stop_codon:yes gene_type:complete
MKFKLKNGDLVFYNDQLGIIVGRCQRNPGHPRGYLIFVSGAVKEAASYEVILKMR